MEINEIKEFQHKKKIIQITNKNQYSLRKKIVLKVSNLNVKNNETIRFSLYENSGFIGHQQKDNDYYIRVPNNLVGYDNQPTITYIYVHYFPKDLYTYTDDIQVFSEYDLSKLETNNSNKYKLTFKDNKPYIQSLFDDNTIKDPNYKNYIQSNIENNPSDMTDTGLFPLSSHYRQNPYFSYQHPTLGETVPKWIKKEYTSSSTNNYPYWEAKIYRDDLSPLISDGVENTNEDTPLNVFLDYDYLPTSTEYHQHFYGFESQLSTLSKDYNILEGEKLNILNPQFGEENKNYRIIQLSNPFNQKYSMYVPKGKRYDLSLKSITDENWQYNKCHDYYIYKGTSTTIFFEAPINKNKIYSLKYLIYIPLKSNTSNKTCYISVNGNKISDPFLYQDKIMKNRWIYHEVPFQSDGGYNIIKIVGSDDDVPIYFYDIFIEEMPNYSPTIKYSERGISVVEENQFTTRFVKNGIEDAKTIQQVANSWNEKKYTNLPTPQSDIRFIVGSEEDIYYDENTMNLIHTHTKNEGAKYQINNNHILVGKNSDNLSLQYDKNAMILTATYNNLLTFTKGVNNKFYITILDEYNRPITEGRIKCAIYDRKASNFECIDFEPPRGQCLDIDGYHEPNEKGIVLYNGIDFSKLELNTNDSPKVYYLRITYENKNCRDETITIFKTCALKKETYNITLMSRNNILNANNTISINNNNLPYQVQAKITNQLNHEINYGYCELFIDDELIQSTIVDSNGIADFYLSEANIKNGSHKMYVVYYQKWDKREKVSLIHHIQCNYDTKPALPIKTQILQTNKNKSILEQQNIYTYNNTIYLDENSPLFTVLNFKEKEELHIEFYRKINNGTNTLVGSIETFKSDCQKRIQGKEIGFIKCNDKNSNRFENLFYIFDTLDGQGIQKGQTIKYTIKILDDNKYRTNSKEIFFICR